jgi:hypothetical protein
MNRQYLDAKKLNVLLLNFQVVHSISDMLLRQRSSMSDRSSFTDSDELADNWAELDPDSSDEVRLL